MNPTVATVPLRVLLVEDSDDDAELILRALRAGGYDPRYRRVDTPQALAAALDQECWEVVISDYKMPGFSGLAALGLVKSRGLNLPFILASGVIGEDVAVDAMRAGADDYVMKRNLARLPLAISRELRDAEARRERERAEDAVKRQLLFIRALSDSIGEGVCAVDTAGHITFSNTGTARMLGFREEDLLGHDLHEVFHPNRCEDPHSNAGSCPILDVLRSRAPYHSDDDLVQRRDGILVPVSLTASPLRRDNSIEGAVIVFEDITERKRFAQGERFLARASASLAELLDFERALERAASLCVPDAADVCAVLVENEEGKISQVTVGGMVQPGEPPSMRHRAATPEIRSILRDEPPELLPTAPAALLSAVANSPAEQTILEAGGPWCSLRASLRGREGNGTMIWLGNPAHRHAFDATDVRILEELAHLVAMVIDNARLYRAAQQSIRARDDFLSIASHELRTPLTPVRLEIENLRDSARRGTLKDQPPARVTASLESAARQVDRLGRLVANLLDVSRIVAGRLTLERERVDLVALTREVIVRAESDIRRAHTTVAFEGVEKIIGRWDRLQIEQVVTNLLSNALKYGASKPIELAVRVERGRAILLVRDHGIGIPPEQQERIFGRFERAVSVRVPGGLGLGLYIVRQFVEAHGGVVRLESDEGAGSTFIVELPID